jgi:adenylyl-sulfate kinase
MNHYSVEISSKTIVHYMNQESNTVDRKNREDLLKQKSMLIWLTGLSGSGKTTIANLVEQKLNELEYLTYLLDGDIVRNGINKDLGFSDADRAMNNNRVAEIAKLFLDSGIVVLASFISPFEKDRAMVKEIVGAQNFIEIFIDTPLEECERRDVKGLYKRARSGEIPSFTGISSPYEKPQNSDLTVRTMDVNEDEAAEIVLNTILTSISYK